MSRLSRVVARAFSSFCNSSARNQVTSTGFSSVQKLEACFGKIAQEQTPKSVPSQTGSWGKIGFGFAAAFLTGASVGSATAAVADVKVESVIVDGLRVTAGGAVKIQHQVIFVLGGPGSGKGTQCAKLVEEFDIAHFSAGDLLREHVKSGTPDGNMVADMIKNGQIVPAEVTINLLQKAMEKSGKHKILIDGFPRNDDNRETFQRVVGYDCSMVLFFDCPEDVLEKRLLARNQGRIDDNIESIKKRFRVFVEQSMPVIEHYEKLGKVKRINTNRPVDEIYQEVRGYLLELDKSA